MRVQAAGGEWGSIQTEVCGTQIEFCAEGKAVDEVWRIWGISEGKEPLLIGVPEPSGESMVLRRRLSQAFLSCCGYWPTLPERYAIGASPEVVFVLGEAAQAEERFGIHEERVGAYRVLRCPFMAKRPFLLAYLFSFCRIHGDAAEVWIEMKSGRPQWDPPNVNQ